MHGKARPVNRFNQAQIDLWAIWQQVRFGLHHQLGGRGLDAVENPLHNGDTFGKALLRHIERVGIAPIACLDGAAMNHTAAGAHFIGIGQSPANFIDILLAQRRVGIEDVDTIGTIFCQHNIGFGIGMFVFLPFYGVLNVFTESCAKAKLPVNCHFFFKGCHFAKDGATESHDPLLDCKRFRSTFNDNSGCPGLQDDLTTVVIRTDLHGILELAHGQHVGDQLLRHRRIGQHLHDLKGPVAVVMPLPHQ